MQSAHIEDIPLSLPPAEEHFGRNSNTIPAVSKIVSILFPFLESIFPVFGNFRSYCIIPKQLVQCSKAHHPSICTVLLVFSERTAIAFYLQHGIMYALVAHTFYPLRSGDIYAKKEFQR